MASDIDRRLLERRTGVERRSNWREATERFAFDLIDDLLVLEERMRVAIPYPDSLIYWANELGRVIRRHQEP